MCTEVGTAGYKEGVLISVQTSISILMWGCNVPQCTFPSRCSQSGGFDRDRTLGGGCRPPKSQTADSAWGLLLWLGEVVFFPAGGVSLLRSHVTHWMSHGRKSTGCTASERMREKETHRIFSGTQQPEEPQTPTSVETQSLPLAEE